MYFEVTSKRSRVLCLVPLNWRGLWLFLHPPNFWCLCQHHVWYNWTRLKQNVWSYKQNEKASALHLFTSYANSIIPLFAAPGKHQHPDKEQSVRALSGRKYVGKFLPWETHLLQNRKYSFVQWYLTSNYRASRHDQFFWIPLSSWTAPKT